MKTESSAGKEISFEEAYRQLETLVGSLESGQCELEDSLESYERGIALLRICRQKLAGVSRRVELLKGIDEQGEPVLEQLDETTLSSRTDVAGRQNSGTNVAEPRATSSVSSVCKTPGVLPPNESRFETPDERRAVQSGVQSCDQRQGRAPRAEDDANQRKRAPVRRTRCDGASSLFDVGGAAETQAPRGGSFFDPSGAPPF